MDKPRIALVSVFRESGIGGVAVHSSNLLRRLRGAGWRVVKVDYARARLPSGWGAKATTLVRQIGRLLRARLRGVRLYHFHASNQAIVFYLLAPWLRLAGGRVVLSIHSGYGYDRWLGEHPGFDRLNRALLRCANRLVFMNPEEAERIWRRYPFMAGRIVTVNPFIAPPPGELAATGDRPAGDGIFRVATLGAWAARYNVEEAAEAVHRFVLSTGVPTEMTVVQSTGMVEPEYRARLLRDFERLRADMTITVLEDVDDVPAVMRRQDLFIRPSKLDSYGLCVAEALAVGTPVIATDVCRRCAAARLYRQGDLDALVEHIQEVYRAGDGSDTSLLAPEEDSFRGYLAIYEVLDR